MSRRHTASAQPKKAHEDKTPQQHKEPCIGQNRRPGRSDPIARGREETCLHSDSTAASTTVSDATDFVARRNARGAHHSGAKPTAEQLDQLYNHQRLSSGEIARQYGVTRKTVTNWLEQAVIRRRTAKEAGMVRSQAEAEFVPEAEREDCILDRAWEARPERRIKNKVACRLCFRVVGRLTGKTAHLAVHHKGMTGDEYARLMPGHRHDCFQHTADTNGLEVEMSMDDWCRDWATADEIRNWRTDPNLAQAQEYVGCLECGRKVFRQTQIQTHLKAKHGWTLEQYHKRYPGAPTGSLELRRKQKDKTKERYHKKKQALAEKEQQVLDLRAQVEAAKQAQQRVKPKGKRGPKQQPIKDQQWYIIGKLIEDRIPVQQKQDKHSIVEARRVIANKRKLQHDTAADYHKRFRRAHPV